MSITLGFGQTKTAILPQLLTRAAAAVHTVLVLALVVGLVAFVRTFGFEYFHGDHAALLGVVHALLGN